MTGLVCNILETSTPEILQKIITKDKDGIETIEFDNFAKTPEKLMAKEKKRLERAAKRENTNDPIATMMPGFENWYTWRMKNWGTKSKAFSFLKISPNRVHFETEITPAEKIVELISKKFPNETFKFAYAGDDLGNYPVGMFTMKNGKTIERYEVDEGSILAKNFASYIVEGEPYHEIARRNLRTGFESESELNKILLHEIINSKDFHARIAFQHRNFNYYNPFEFFNLEDVDLTFD